MPDEMLDSSHPGLVDATDVALVDKSHKDGDRCPVCECTDWYIIQNPAFNTIATIPMASKDGDISIPGGILAVTLACQRCGFVRQHVKQLFDGFVKSLKDKKP